MAFIRVRIRARGITVLCIAFAAGCIEENPDWHAADDETAEADHGDDPATTDDAAEDGEMGSGDGGTGPTSDETSDEPGDESDSTDTGSTGNADEGNGGETDTGGTESGDSDTDTDQLTCLELWSQDQWTLEEPTELTQLNSNTFDYDPRLSGDGLTIFFASSRDGDTDVYSATRPDLQSPFGTPSAVAWVNSMDHEFAYVEAGDGLTAVVATDRAGGEGTVDLWMATRGDPQDAFGALDPLEEVNTAEEEWDPFLSLDGLRLYWTTGSESGDNLRWASRATRDDPFGTPQSTEVDDPLAYEDSPIVTPDDLVIMFGSTRGGGPGDHDLWIAKRATTGDPFGAPGLLPIINTQHREGELGLSPDACELYFGSDRPGGTGGWDLYVTRIVP